MRILAVALLCLGLGLAACQPPPPAPAPDPMSLRTPSAGPVVGKAGRYGGHAWLGIPYAAPPVGALRWRAPRPAPAWHETRQALAFGARCPQLASALEGAEHPGQRIGQEDCLTLNVYAPAFTPDTVPTGGERLPVMLWIHGGGNSIGASSFYDGSHLASSQDLVVVTINYRLGPLGWFRHASLRGEGTTPEDRSGNYGTLDIIRALQWVHDDIAAFGGDPGNVTVFGESAGGRNTFTLLVSPLARGLFQRAIVESGGTGLTSPAEAEHFVDAASPGSADSSGEVLLRLLEKRGEASDRESAKRRLASLDGVQVAALLRGVDLDTLFSLYGDAALEPRLGMLDVPRLFREPTVLPEDEYAAFAAGRYHRVPVITGTNRDEDKLFLYSDDAYVHRIFGVIPRLRDPARYQLVADYVSRAWKATSVDEIAPLLLAAQGPSVFAYRFDWDEEPTLFGADLSVIMGAAHAFEIPFVFGHFDLGRAGNVIFSEQNAKGRLALSSAMMSYWAEFARTGDPGRGRDGSLPAWTPWNPDGADKYLVLDTPDDGGVRMAGRTESVAGLVAEIRSDPRFHGDEDRCAMLSALSKRYDRFEAELREQGGVQLACAGVVSGAAAAAGK